MKFKLSIPSELSEIKLKDYQKYIKIVQENEDAHEFLNIKAVEIFCNIKINDINAIKVADFNDILQTLNNTLQQKTKLLQRFKMNGVEFGFIPKLDDISMGEFVDLQNYLGDNNSLNKAMAVMYRPITFDKNGMYLIEDYEGSEKYADAMRDAPLNVVLGANVFFYNLGKELLKGTMNYLAEEGQKNIQVKQVLEESGDGINQFMQLLEDDFPNLKQSLN